VPLEEYVIVYKTGNFFRDQRVAPMIFSIMPESMEKLIPTVITIFVCAFGWWVRKKRAAAELAEGHNVSE
jgi:hypothetical protein